MKEENKKFIVWYNNLQGFQKRYAARQICAACSISRPTLSRWLEGETPIKNPYRMVINSIAGQQLFQTEKITQLAI